MKTVTGSYCKLDGIFRQIFSCACALAFAGCGASTVTPTRYTGTELPKPDRILIYNFAITPDDVDLDRGVGPLVIRAAGSESQTEEEIQVGRIVAKSLTENLVQALRAQGIDADAATATVLPGSTTASIKGRFQRIDQGDRTMRTLVGFGLGASHVRTHVQIFQGSGSNMRLVAEGETSTESNLKPGLGPMLGLGAATGGLALAGAVGGTTTVANEAVLATVQEAAKRTAKQIADSIGDYYRRQGWTY